MAIKMYPGVTRDVLFINMLNLGTIISGRFREY